MKAILFAVMLSAAPVAAQSINPQDYAERFCQLRSLDVGDDAARKAAVSYSYRMNRPASEAAADIREAVRLTNQLCPARSL